MKYKLLIILAAAVLLMSVSAVSADDNQTKDVSKIEASDVTGYESFNIDINVKLTSANKTLSSKPISINLAGKTYNKTTDKNGKAKLSLKLSKGTYKVNFIFAGDNETQSSTLTKTVKIKAAQKTSLTVGDKDINYRQGSKCLFYVVLKNQKGKVIKNQDVIIKVKGKTYNVKTDSKGHAKVFLNLKKGTYKIKYGFKKKSPYLASSGSVKIKVKKSIPKGYGYWLWSSNMNKVNLKSLAGKGTKHIFLLASTISQHGKSKVVNFISKAGKYGIKVHIWMQICFSGGKWVRPTNEDNSFKYSFINKKVKEAKSYARIKGVDGLHLDYIRYGGTAHLYTTSTDAINYIVKKITSEIRKINENIIVSAAIMPEPSSLKKYYGQDLPTMTKYLDAVIPMIYKENYHKSSSWVKSVTKNYVSQSNGAQVWSGLQTYKLSGGLHKLSQKTLVKDSRAALSGGALGVVLFRFGISINFNFKKI